jgi:hypothetical protein
MLNEWLTSCDVPPCACACVHVCCTWETIKHWLISPIDIYTLESMSVSLLSPVSATADVSWMILLIDFCISSVLVCLRLYPPHCEHGHLFAICTYTTRGKHGQTLSEIQIKKGQCASWACILENFDARVGVAAKATSWFFNTLRTGLLNCFNARSRGLTFRHRASCI